MTRKHTNETRLILIGNESGQEFIGAWAIPGRLPEMHRFPFESREMFSQRCRLALTGHGTAMGWLMYPGGALHPEHSNRAIAAAVGVDDKTVRSVRAALPVAEFPQLTRRVGADGKAYKATHQAVTTSAASLITKTDVVQASVARGAGYHPYPMQVTLTAFPSERRNEREKAPVGQKQIS
jgi:hypothetical protein